MPRPVTVFSASDRRLVEALARHGVHAREIACEVGTSVKTLRKHCRAELEKGLANVRCTPISALWRKAAKGNFGAMRLWFRMNEFDSRHASIEKATEYVQNARTK